MPFEILGEISDLETIATGNKIREIKRVRRIYGRGRWRKRKGVHPKGEMTNSLTGALLSFGGPAEQIAVMHRILVASLVVERPN